MSMYVYTYIYIYICIYVQAGTIYLAEPRLRPRPSNSPWRLGGEVGAVGGRLVPGPALAYKGILFLHDLCTHTYCILSYNNLYHLILSYILLHYPRITVYHAILSGAISSFDISICALFAILPRQGHAWACTSPCSRYKGTQPSGIQEIFRALSLWPQQC